MNRKQINIIVILAVAVVAIFIGLGFFGFNALTSMQPQQTPDTSNGTQPQADLGPAQAILNEIQTTGTVSALKTADLTVGTGDPVVAGDTLTMNYTGLLPDGTVFDASSAHGKPFTFTIGKGQVIQGWEQGILGMQAGGKRLLAIPPSLGYGAAANGPIPANSTLIFQVELISRTPAGATKAQ